MTEMKKILVPIDFSKASKDAAVYAAKLALDMNAGITLLTVVNSDPSNQTLTHWRKLEKEMTDAAQEGTAALTDEIRAAVGGDLAIDSQIVLGYPVQEKIEERVKAQGIDLVVMGTRGATGLKRKFMGSNATSVINSSSVPVITVPAGGAYRPIKRILYASDWKNLHYEITKVALFARMLHATIDVLHVAQEDMEVKSTYLLERELIDITHYSDIHVHISDGDDIVAEVSSFAEENHADILVMFTEKMTYFKKAFGKSKTREIAFGGKIALLTLNKTAAEYATMQGWEFDLNFK
jgi:nucleotide-binding universal stress UspA family protein